MTWVTVLTLVFLLLLLTGLVSWIVLYIQFCNSVEKRWATQVLNLLWDAERRVRSENQQLRKLTAERDAKFHSLHEKVFAEHLCDYSVDELEAYPGIGPGTVGKLRAAGFVNLATLQCARIQIHGLGKKRLADIKYAIRNLLSKARSTFDGGNGRQAHTLAEQLETLSTHYEFLETRAQTRARAAKDFIDRLGETVAYARAVNFGRWFRPISNEVLIPAEVMDASLPDLEAALQAAEHRIVPNGTAKHPQTPPEAIPVPPVSPPRPNVPPKQAPKPAGPIRDECLGLLEIPAGTEVSADLVRRQWNLMSERLAPEKVASMGVDFVNLAQTKLAAIRRIAESLLEAMGEKLEIKPPTPPVQDSRHNPDLDDVLGGM